MCPSLVQTTSDVLIATPRGQLSDLHCQTFLKPLTQLIIPPRTFFPLGSQDSALQGCSCGPPYQPSPALSTPTPAGCHPVSRLSADPRSSPDLHIQLLDANHSPEHLPFNVQEASLLNMPKTNPIWSPRLPHENESLEPSLVRPFLSHSPSSPLANPVGSGFRINPHANLTALPSYHPGPGPNYSSQFHGLPVSTWQPGDPLESVCPQWQGCPRGAFAS